MGTNKDKSLATSVNRQRHAGERLYADMSALHAPLTEEAILRLVQQLEVHQVELESQNEELRRVQEHLEVSRNEYTELYDFAPVAYFTMDAAGVIRQVNLAGAQLLGVERQILVNRPLAGFIADTQGKEIFSRHLASVARGPEVNRCEIRLRKKDGAEIYGELQSVTVARGANGGGQVQILCSIVDGTAARLLERKLQEAHDRLELTVSERTGELARANLQLTQEIGERMRVEESLRVAYAEITRLKDRLQAENVYLQQEVARHFNFGEIVGQSPSLARVTLQVEQVAPMNATVLLLGETGTGKGVVARAIHSSSTRKGHPMITINCATLPATLVESELFGREKGAFTGAFARQIGRFELADGGTIFLDEIGEMPLELQSKLLRVVQDGEFERVGGTHTLRTDVRIIAATNRDLEQEVRSGKFREDLFYRLNVFPITMPPLRERREDIPLLVNHFLAKFNRKIGKKVEIVGQETLDALREYHWPGNVRELESVIERAVIISRGSVLQVDRLDCLVQKAAADRVERDVEGDQKGRSDVKVLADLERDHIMGVLQQTGWRIEGKNGAAGILGLNASTLRARMRKFGITRG